MTDAGLTPEGMDPDVAALLAALRGLHIAVTAAAIAAATPPPPAEAAGYDSAHQAERWLQRQRAASRWRRRPRITVTPEAVKAAAEAIRAAVSEWTVADATAGHVRDTHEAAARQALEAAAPWLSVNLGDSPEPHRG